MRNLKLGYGNQHHLYRLVQESFTNIHKHAAARLGLSGVDLWKG